MSNQLGRWVQKQLKQRSWNQTRLAEIAQISQPNISRLISKTPKHPNEAICGEKVAQGLAQAFQVNPVFVMRLAGIIKTPSRSRNFSTWLVGELLLQDISQEELCERSGIDLQTLVELSKGIPPSLEMVQQLATALDLDPLIIEERAGLLGVEDETYFNALEIALINDYRALPPAGQVIIREIMQSFKKNSNAFSKK